jgi:hypothetical protein
MGRGEGGRGAMERTVVAMESDGLEFRGVPLPSRISLIEEKESSGWRRKRIITRSSSGIISCEISFCDKS